MKTLSDKCWNFSPTFSGAQLEQRRGSTGAISTSHGKVSRTSVERRCITVCVCVPGCRMGYTMSLARLPPKRTILLTKRFLIVTCHRCALDAESAPDRFPVEVRFQKTRYASLRSSHGDDYRETPFIAVHFHRRAFPIVCIQTVVPIINTIARYIRLQSRRRPSLTDIHFVRKYLCNIRLRCGQLVIVKHRPILVVFGSSFLRQIGLKFCFHIPPRLTCVYALIGKY